MIAGMPLPTAWLRMSVEVAGEHYQSSCLTEIVKNLQNISRICGFSPEDGIYIMQEDHIKHTTTVTYYAQKKIPEKNGQNSCGGLPDVF
jgi:hypothetical protein